VGLKLLCYPGLVEIGVFVKSGTVGKNRYDSEAHVRVFLAGKGFFFELRESLPMSCCHRQNADKIQSTACSPTNSQLFEDVHRGGGSQIGDFEGSIDHRRLETKGGSLEGILLLYLVVTPNTAGPAYPKPVPAIPGATQYAAPLSFLNWSKIT
jgi:hypothetical protein